MSEMPPTLRSTDFKELQIPSFTNWDKVSSVTTILADLEAGTFFDAAMFQQQMWRDDRVRGCMSVRVNSVLGMPWHMEAADHSAGKRSSKIADEATKLWPLMAPEPELAQLVTWALMLGMAPAQKLWARSATAWVPSFLPWYPGAVYFDTTDNVYKLQHSRGILNITEEDPDWLLCTPFGYKYGRLNGLLGALAMPYLCRQWAFRDRARHSERHGMPFLQLIAPAAAENSEVAAARRAAAIMGSESVFATKQGEDGNKWDIKLIEATANAHQTFSSQLDHLDDVIAVTILGQTMSTKGQGGLGSQQDSGGTVRRDVMRFDAKVIGWIADNLLRDWALMNYGDAALAPKLVIEIDPPEDEERKARILGLVADGIIKFQTARVNVDVENVCEEAGVPLMPGMPVTEDPEAAGAGPKPDPAEVAAQAQAALPPEEKAPVP